MPSSSPATAGDSTRGATEKTGLVRRLVPVVVGVAALVALILLGRQAGAYLPRFAAWVQSLGVWAPVAYILGYAAAAVAFLPGSVLTLAAGIVFGLGFGTLYAFVGATLGASLAFLVARYLARSWVEKKLESAPRFRAIDRAVGKEGLKFVTLLRLSPVMPFNLLNYALGLTKIGFPQYLLASLAMLPGTLLYVYYGTLIGDLARLASGTKIEGGAERWVFLGVGLVATLAVSLLLAKKAKQAIAEEVEGGAS
ncbi:MAG TPA: TVP38/TMEM64 family protein [Thermoanaerobaculia bacterium]|nr:TVP38/TMEM64 family protein [Thermoanaerobaculia bacterium]